MRNKRRDGERIKQMDGFHLIAPYVMPKRTEAEVSSTEQFDITELNAYIKKRNEEEGTNLKLFHAICTSVARTIYLRPKMNIFISGKTYYQRNEITLSFVVKRKFSDEAEEMMMILNVEPEMNIDKISEIIVGKVGEVRKKKTNNIDKLMKNVGKMPRLVMEIIFAVVRRLEYHGIMPKFLSDGDPSYTTVMLSNLGSIGAGAPYHHLSNYGTCSIMITIGTIHKEMKLMPDGTQQERDVVDCTFVLDERIADGFYFAKSFRITKYLIEHPEAMEQPIRESVPVDL